MKLLLALLLAAGGFAQPAADPWKPLAFLIGEWIGEGGGKPGEATSGGFSFAFELDGKILVRRNFAVYANSRHDDLMIVYPGPPMRAVYWDNEGHVIQYEVTPAAGGATFLSAPSDGEPRFRLTYRRSGAGLEIAFEIAPPGKPGAFKPYVTARARRK